MLSLMPLNSSDRMGYMTANARDVAIAAQKGQQKKKGAGNRWWAHDGGAAKVGQQNRGEQWYYWSEKIPEIFRKLTVRGEAPVVRHNRSTDPAVREQDQDQQSQQHTDSVTSGVAGSRSAMESTWSAPTATATSSDTNRNGSNSRSQRKSAAETAMGRFSPDPAIRRVDGDGESHLTSPFPGFDLQQQVYSISALDLFRNDDSVYSCVKPQKTTIEAWIFRTGFRSAPAGNKSSDLITLSLDRPEKLSPPVSCAVDDEEDEH